jgi:hypothetical protein
VVLHIPVQQLARYQPASKTWQIETGTYNIWVGNSSRSIDLQAITVHIASQ